MSAAHPACRHAQRTRPQPHLLLLVRALRGARYLGGAPRGCRHAWSLEAETLFGSWRACGPAGGLSVGNGQTARRAAAAAAARRLAGAGAASAAPRACVEVLAGPGSGVETGCWPGEGVRGPRHGKRAGSLPLFRSQTPASRALPLAAHWTEGARTVIVGVTSSQGDLPGPAPPTLSRALGPSLPTKHTSSLPLGAYHTRVACAPTLAGARAAQ